MTFPHFSTWTQYQWSLRWHFLFHVTGVGLQFPGGKDLQNLLVKPHCCQDGNIEVSLPLTAAIQETQSDLFLPLKLTWKDKISSV